MQLLKSKWIVLIGSLVVAITAGTTVVIAVGYAGSEPPSGVSTGVSSLDRLPAVSNLPPRCRRGLPTTAPSRERIRLKPGRASDVSVQLSARRRATSTRSGREAEQHVT